MIRDRALDDTTIEDDPNLHPLFNKEVISWMDEAISLGNKARLSSPPNPWVGALVVQNGTVIGRGHTQPPGGDHAEIVALKEAGKNAKGATLVATLEPCSHHGKTPPCTDAILKAGIKKVVVGIEDPDVRVSGKGIEQLRKANLEVSVGCLKQEISHSLRPYIHHRKTGLPFVVIKIGISIDGKMTDSKGQSKWITSETARVRTHGVRGESQAILVGSGTFLRDNPKLNVRHPPFPPIQPLRVVLDRRGRIEDKGEFDLVSREPDLKKVLKELGDRNVLQLMVEGGAELLNSFLKEDLVDLLYTHYNGRIFGSGVALNHLDNVSSPSRFIPESTHLYGDTVEVIWVRASPSSK